MTATSGKDRPGVAAKELATELTGTGCHGCAPVTRGTLLMQLVEKAYWVAALLLVFAVYSFFLAPPAPNELSRYDLLISLARDHSVAIDRYHHNTFDKATFQGHQYTDKAIGTSLLGLPTWLLADRLYRFGEYGEVRTDFPIWAANAGAVAIPSALLVLLVYWVARWLAGDRLRALLTAGAYGFGTLAFPFATVFYGHQPAAFFGFAGFAAILAAARTSYGQRLWLALAGLLAGLAVLTEYPAGIIAVLVGVYLLANRDWRGHWWAFTAGGAAALLPLAAYNTAAFGAPWHLGYGFVQDPSFAGMGSGMMGVTLPKLSALREITVGEAGLLTRSPFLALALLGLLMGWREHRARPEVLLCAGVSLAFLLYNAGYYLPMGGHGTGPRFLVPALPFMSLPLAWLPRRTWWLAGPLGVVSAALMLMITADIPKAFPGTGGSWFPYWWMRFQEGHVVYTWGHLKYGLQGLASLAPLLLLAAGGLAVYATRWLTEPVGRVAALGVALLAYSVVSAPSLSVPALYAPLALEDRIAAGEAYPSSLVFGDQINLLGYSLDQQRVQPGGQIMLTIYWQARRPMDESWTVFIHLLGKDGQVLGGWDTVPGAAAYPTEMWEPGRVVGETYRVPLKQSIEAPTVCRVEVGWYRFTTGERMAAADGAGVQLGDSPLLTRLAIPGPVPDRTAFAPIDADLGGQVKLAGYKVDGSDLGKLRGRILWEAIGRPEKDYTVFVQALKDGRVLAQYDSQPLGGRYPTSLWEPGELVADHFELALNGLRLEGATLVMGMYDLETMQRLPIGESTFVEIPLH